MVVPTVSGFTARARAARPTPRWFATAADEPRSRRVGDGITLGLALSGVAFLGWIEHPPVAFFRGLETFLRSIPSFLDGAFAIASDAFVVFAIALIVVAFVRRRRSVARDLVLAAFVAAVTVLLVGRVVEGSWPDVWDSLRSAEPPGWFPATRIALPGAVYLTAAPHLALPIRRFGRWMFGLATLSAVVLEATSFAGALAGVLVAVVAAASVHLMLGSSAGRPSLAAVRAAMHQLGIDAHSLEPADRQPAGMFLVRARDDSGPLVVKVYGRDANDTRIVASFWRKVWYRQAEGSLLLGRLAQAMHEALVTLLAAQAGVVTDQVVTASSTADDDALLVLRPVGLTLIGDARGATERPDLEELLDDPAEQRARVGQMWAALAALHAAGIAHGAIDERHIVLVDGDVGFCELRSSSIAPSPPQLAADRAQLLLTTVLRFGEELAFDAARNALAEDVLAEALTYLQMPALTSVQRAAVKGEDVDLDELRERLAGAVGVEAPELQKLRRVSWGSLLQSGLMLIAFSMLATSFTKIDTDDLLNALSDAVWWILAVAFVLGQLPRVAQSCSTLGACPIPLPLGPVYALQLAISYVNLAIPTSAARIAVNVRFFQRHGLAPGSAVAIGALDGFAGFIIQAVLLFSILVFTPASLNVALDVDVSGVAGSILRIVVVIAVVAILLAVARPSWRRAVSGFIRTALHDARSALNGLQSPRRIGLLFGGNLVAEILFASALGACLLAFGESVGLGQLLLINLTTALLAGLVPVPGGIGVTEGSLTFGLVTAGVPEEIALAAVLMYRMATFYLPPIWGFFAFRWLEHNRHL